MTIRASRPLAFGTALALLLQVVMPPMALAHDFTVPGGTSPGSPGRPGGGQAPPQNPSSGDPTVQSNADPVDVQLGDYVLTRQDLLLPSRGPSVDLRFTYRSRSAYNSSFGYGWDMAYNRRVRKLANNNLLVLRGTNRQDEFAFSPPNTYTAPPGIYDTLVQNGNGTYTLTSKHGAKESYDVNGNLTRLEDRNGNALAFSYDPLGLLPLSGASRYFVDMTTGVTAREYRLLRISDASGHFIAFTYNADGRLDTVVSEGRTIRYAYDPSGNGDLISVTSPATPDFPSGSTTTYTYTDHNLTSITDPKGQTYLTNVYDAATDRLTDQTYGNGSSHLSYTTGSTCPSTPGHGSAGYNLSLNPLMVNTSFSLTVGWSVPADRATHPTDRIALFQRGAANTGSSIGFSVNGATSGTRVISNSSAISDLYEARYLLDNGTTNVASSNTVCVGATPLISGAVTAVDITNRNNFTTHYAFDAAGHITQIKQLTDGMPAGEPASFITNYEYDANGNRTRAVFPRGNAIEYTFDAKGNLTQLRRKNIGIAKGVNDPSDLVTSFTYEPQFNFIKTITDPRGNTTTYTYDYDLGEASHGNLRKITAPVVDGLTPQAVFTYNSFGQALTATDPNGNITNYAYDSTTGYLMQVTRGFGTAQAATTTMGHDTVGNVISLTDANAHTTTFTYDARNQLVKAVAPAPLSFETDYSYDANGNVIQIDRQATTTAPGARPALGTTSPTDNWQSTVYAYTSRDELASVTDDLGHTTSFTYDGTGNRHTVTDALARTTTYDYEERNLLGKVTDAETVPGITQYAYDPNGQLASIIDANSNTTTYAYDGFDRLIKMAYPDGTHEDYAYDAASNLTSRITPATQTLTYTYDALNRLRSKIAPEETTTYAYDVGSRLTTAADADVSLTYTYDALNRATQVVTTPISGPAATTVAYLYDGVGNRTKLTYPDSSFITYTYDALNRLDLIKTSAGATIADFNHDALSRRSSLSLANGTAAAYLYDAASRLTQVTHTGPGSTTLATATYTYDTVDHRLTMTTAAGAHAYTYNRRDELTVATYPAGFAFPNTTFTYDPVGNRTQVAAGTTTAYTPNLLNQYAQVGVTNFTYDPNGNLTNDAVRTYTYDSENRLKTSSASGATYTYDPFGRRLTKTVSGVTTRLLYDGDDLLAETNSAGTIQATYVYSLGIDEPVRMTRGATTSYYHADGLGSIVALSNSAGTVVERASYDVYGRPSLTTGTGTPMATSALGNRLLFTGREYDQETGLYDYRARYYDPRLGRFLSRDPLGYLPDQHLYRYVGNNPTNWIDPLGLDKGQPGGSGGGGPGSGGGGGGGPGGPGGGGKPWWENLAEGRYYGTGLGQEAMETFAQLQVTTGNWFWAVPGSFAALWTPETYKATLRTFIAAGGPTLARGAFRPGGWLNQGPYFRIGWGRHNGEVFRIAGEWVNRLTGKGHIDLWRR